MSVLSSLKLVAAKRPQAMPTIQIRRNKLGKQLFEQIKLATALSEGKTYAPLQLRNVRNKESGEVKAIEIARRIRQWWFISETGKVCMKWTPKTGQQFKWDNVTRNGVNHDRDQKAQRSPAGVQSQGGA